MTSELAQHQRTGLPPAEPQAPKSTDDGSPVPWRSRAIAVVAVAWLAFCIVHLLLTGRFALWVIPGLTPPLVFATVPACIATLALAAPRRRRSITATAVVAALITIPFNGLNLRALTPPPEPVPGSTVTIATQNTDYWAQNRDGTWTAKRDKNSLFRHLKSLNADVYLLQEHMLRINNRPVPIAGLADLRRAFPGYQVVARGTLVTLSRMPVIAVDTVRAIDHPRLQFPPPYGLRVDIETPDGVISTYNVHMPVQLLLEPSLFSSEFYTEIGQRQARRTHEFEALTAAVKANRNPLLIGGDFNTSPAMGDIHPLLGITDDATRASRSLYPVSWREGGHVPRMWRVDWALSRNDLHVNSYNLPSSEGNSDHTSQLVSVTVPDRTLRS